MNRQGIPAERELQERNRIATSKKSSKRANELQKVDLLPPKRKQKIPSELQRQQQESSRTETENRGCGKEPRGRPEHLKPRPHPVLEHTDNCDPRRMPKKKNLR